MAVFQLQCREDEERQADICRKEASSQLLQMMANFTNSAILTQI